MPGSLPGGVPSRSAFSVSWTAWIAALNGWCPCRQTRTRRRGEIVEVHHLGPAAADDERQLGRLADRVDLGARPDADEEERVDAGRLVGTAAADRVVETGDRGRGGAGGR